MVRQSLIRCIEREQACIGICEKECNHYIVNSISSGQSCDRLDSVKGHGNAVCESKCSRISSELAVVSDGPVWEVSVK